MNRLRNSLIGVASVAIIGTFLAANTRVTHAVGGPVVVQILGTASTADVNNQDLQPVQFALFPHSSSEPFGVDGFTVPAHKRLIIDYYSGQLTVFPGSVELVTTLNGVQANHYVVLNGTTSNNFNQMCRIIADPGTTVNAAATSSTSSAGAVITCTGHYVNE